MTSKKYNWLGLSLEMMSEYFQMEVRSKSDAYKYWNIDEHLLSILEFSGLICQPDKDEKFNERNDIVKDMIKKFTMKNISMMKNDEHNTKTDINFDNVALSNLLLLSMIVNREEGNKL